jgi:hypothetical protein
VKIFQFFHTFVVISLVGLADGNSIMARTTPTHRLLKNKLSGEFAWSAQMDPLFTAAGGGGSGQMEAWRLPKPKVLRGVVIGGVIKQRWCTLVR